MNIQSTHHLKKGKIKRNAVKRSTRGKKSNLKSFIPALILIGTLFLMAAASVRINSETENLSREATYLKRQIHRQNRYIANTNIKVASLKGKVIFRQLKRFRLKLRNPTAGQVRILRLPPKNRIANERFSVKEPTLMLSRR